MKIWLMNHYASMQYRDKSGRHYWFAKELKRRGYEPTVFCASTYHDSRDRVEMGSLPCRVMEDPDTGIPFVFVKAHPSVGNGMDRVRNMLDFYRNLFPAARQYGKESGKPDLLLASSVHPLTLVAGIRIAKKLGVPCICEVRDLWPEAIFSFGKVKASSLLGKCLAAGEYWIYRRADALIFTKEGDVDYLREKGWTTAQGGKVDLAKCHYINNGIDIPVYHERMERDVLPDEDLHKGGKFNITYTGIIRPVNHIENLLDCAALLAHDPDVQFLIYGDGSQLPALRERVVRENLTNVKLKGFVERRYIPYILSKSSVNILNYSQSQFNWARGNSSNKLFEYMASGKPIISTVKMGYSLIGRYRCGIELEECTPRALARAILEIRHMPPDAYEAMGKNAAQGARDFDFPLLTDRLESVIQYALYHGKE